LHNFKGNVNAMTTTKIYIKITDPNYVDLVNQCGNTLLEVVCIRLT